jgi:hypothetical protein
MAERAKARHNKLAKEPETASTDSLGSLTENFQKAANILISLVQLYYDDSEATFGDEKFEPLFSDDVLGRLRITTHFSVLWKGNPRLKRVHSQDLYTPRDKAHLDGCVDLLAQ